MSAELKDYIVVLKNIIPQDLRDRILKEYKDCNDWATSGTRGGEDNKIRSCDVIKLSEQNDSTRIAIDNDILQVVKICIGTYNKMFEHVIVDQDTGYDLLRYKTGQFYTQHTDSFLEEPRAISCSMHLNDAYEGGEFAFFDRQLQYRLNAGDVLMFPSNFMYPHEVMPITQGTRYSIITWFR